MQGSILAHKGFLSIWTTYFYRCSSTSEEYTRLEIARHSLQHLVHWFGGTGIVMGLFSTEDIFNASTMSSVLSVGC